MNAINRTASFQKYFIRSKGKSEMFRRKLHCCAAVLIAAMSGCTKQPQTPVARPSPVESTAATPSKEASSPPTNPIELPEINWKELQSLVAEQKGKVVVVDVWSTACEPCMKEFPHLVALQKRHPTDVVAISFDIDFAGIKNKPVSYYRERVLKFLGSQDENQVLHRMCNTAADELFTELNLDSIPAVYVYGRGGALAKRFDGSNSQGEGVSYEKQVAPFVEDLVK